jgi:hypothetical protein
MTSNLYWNCTVFGAVLVEVPGRLYLLIIIFDSSAAEDLPAHIMEAR